MRYQFVEDHREEFMVTLMCRVLDVSPGGYYVWRKRPSSQREMANQELLKEIKAVHEKSNGTYGSPRIYHELKEKVDCSESRVARLMQKHGIAAKQKKRYKRTTKANSGHPVAPNLLDRDFTATAPNQKWTTDITYIPTLEGWLYLAVALDLFSRRIVGWAMSARMTSSLVIDALQMAIQRRQPPTGLLHHSDRGSQYTGQPYQQLLKDNHFIVSMSGTGNCYDNAPTESFFGSLKTEHVHHVLYESRAQARTDIFFYIEAFYNRQRLHSTLGYVSPEAYEAAYHQRQHQLALTPCP
jgi:transposase InsO family protein